MPPIRTKDSQNAESSTSAISRQGINKKKSRAKLKESAPPGVSKLKSALRQARRLLAKENLAADVRIEAERKLKALETDLTAAERANKERTLATRYHKVKFFAWGEEISSKVRKVLEEELFGLRVDLNYVLNYPKLEKYISLFPPEVRHTEGAAATLHSAPDSSATDMKRENFREWVRGKMRAGEMSGEPETLEHGQSIPMGTTGHWESSVDKNDKSAGGKEKGRARQNIEALDDFFEGEDGTGDKGLEASEQGSTRSAEVRAERRLDHSATSSDKRSKLAEKYSMKTKRKKHREDAATPVITQDSFFGDESE
ncbi:hypothetical protein BJV78DRAFT_1300072 [Lactifluus subvellereus]|nr:hypothetical protein BJV78DRAFT_1300072 [Lactifluus subvellereus]